MSAALLWTRDDACGGGRFETAARLVFRSPCTLVSVPQTERVVGKILDNFQNLPLLRVSLARPDLRLASGPHHEREVLVGGEVDGGLHCDGLIEELFVAGSSQHAIIRLCRS